MRLPFPTRIPVLWASIFAVGIFVVQQFEHTNFGFSLLFLAFVMLSTVAFNTAGGFSRPSGGFIFFFAMLTCILGVIWKAVLGEPAETNLDDPLLTMSAYVGSMLCMLGLVYVIRHFLKGRQSFTSKIGGDSLNLSQAALGCLVVAVSFDFINAWGLLPGGNGSLMTLLNHLNAFYPIAIILATLDTIRSSRGRRSIGFVNGVGMAGMTFTGLTAFSKQAMFTPLACWALAAASLHLPLTKKRLFVIALYVFIAGRYLIPLSQIGRDTQYDGEPVSERLDTVVKMLSDPHELRAEYQAGLDDQSENATRGIKIGYFNSAQGFLDRLNMISVDDQLIAFTGRGHVEGLAPIEFDIINIIPHVILPNKESLDVAGGMYSNHGNYYEHEMGTISTGDTTTGISFSSTAEAFHVASWLGIFLLAPIIWGIQFFSADYLYGDPRTSPWALFMLVYFAHAANEGSLGLLIGGLYSINIIVIIAMFFCMKFAPVIGSLFSGNIGRPVALPGRQVARAGAA
jgi:hypothetical protein